MRIGFGIGDAGDIPESQVDKTIVQKLFKDFLPLVIALGAVILLGIGLAIYFCCKNRARKQVFKRMTKEELMAHAESKINKFDNKMEKRNERARQKAIEKWKKRNPGKSIDDLDVSALDETFFATDSEANTSFVNTNSKSFGVNGSNGNSMSAGFDFNS